MDFHANVGGGGGGARKWRYKSILAKKDKRGSKIVTFYEAFNAVGLFSTAVTTTKEK